MKRVFRWAWEEPGRAWYHWDDCDLHNHHIVQKKHLSDEYYINPLCCFHHSCTAHHQNFTTLFLPGTAAFCGNHSFHCISERSEFWLGLDKMHEYTKSGNWTLKVEIEYDVLSNGNPSPRAGTWGFGKWDNFAVAPEADKYRLTIGSRTEQGNMGAWDPFNDNSLNGMFFSTEERDNDNYGGNCARNHKGGWWMNACFHVCLNCNSKSIWNDGSDWENPSISRMWMMKTS